MQEAEKALDAFLVAENNTNATERWQDPDVMDRIENLIGNIGTRLALVPTVEGDDFSESELDDYYADNGSYLADAA
tara:strand:+ start:239 stop:466 length:228 start_codon:yes stop_codon:yes gene_type:complete